MERIVTLDEIGLHDRPRVGGKAFQLARLAARRLPIPPAFAVTTDAFGEALDLAGARPLAERVHRDPTPEAVEALRRALGRVAPSTTLAADLVRRARGLGDRVAVRSSATDEDGRVRSFAGQHLTILQVAPEGVPAAVARCWASLYTDAALAYRGGRGPTPGSMAVVVQRMVEPRAAGVLFTVNPLTGSWREMTVEAVWGLGEGVVSGRVTPHWYVVRRPRRAPRPVQRVLSRVRLQLVQRDLPPLEERWEVSRAGQVVRRPVPEPLRHKPTLDRSALFRLCRLGLRVEAELGEPQDVEWAVDGRGRFHVLQARPITRTGTPRARRDVLWTRRFIGERWPDPATPLGWSLMAPVLEHFIAYPNTQRRYLGGGPPLRLFRSRPYLNASAFRHLAFKLPGAPPPQFMLELVPPEEQDAWQRRHAVLPDVSVYGSFLRETFADRRWRRFRWNPFTNHREWDAFAERLDEELTALSRAPVSEADALRLVKAQRALVRDYVGIHICSLLFANLFFQLLEGALSSWVPEGAAGLMRALAVCPPGNRTLETNEALWTLAEVAGDADLDALEAGRLPGDGPFAAALDEFLDAYGHRSGASWEILAPRWAEEPARIVPFLRAHRQGGEEPAARARRQEQAFSEARAELAGRVSGPRRMVLQRLVKLTRRYLLLRENQRFAFDRVLFATKRTLLWLGARFSDAGWLEEPGDIAFLTWDEVCGLAQGSLSADPVPGWVARRRSQREADAAVEPPVFLRGDEGVTADTTGARLQGLGISPGRVRGTVRVVRTPAEGAALQPGDILVTHAVDPGWTPLLLTAGGVILEMGSRLSHGAVVAREYEVPAVVNLEGVTNRLRDGQEVTVDGSRGVVWLHP